MKPVAWVAGIAIGLLLGVSLGFAIASGTPGARGTRDDGVQRAPDPLGGATVRERSLPPPSTTPPPVAPPSIDAQYDAKYDAMRDDVNPKPRLLLIDAWARDAAPDAPLDLLGRALVDPDPSVRERAQALFDRRLATR